MILDPGPTPTLDQACPGKSYPAELQGVMDRVLQRNPKKRFGDPAALTQALLGVVPQLAETVRIPVVADLPPEAPPRVGAGGEVGATVVSPREKKKGVREGEHRIKVAPGGLGGIVGGVLAIGIVLIFLVKSGLFGGGAPLQGGGLEVHPRSAFIGSGESLDLVASLGETSTSTGDLQVRWMSQDPSVVRVEPTGTLLAGEGRSHFGFSHIRG